MTYQAKKYYTIGEVSEIVDLKEHVLRFWEKEFEVLAPQKSAKGRRKYTDRDIEIIKRIEALLYKEKFTIPGAIKHLSSEILKEEPESSQTELNFSKPEKEKKEDSYLTEKKAIISELKEIIQLLK